MPEGTHYAIHEGRIRRGHAPRQGARTPSGNLIQKAVWGSHRERLRPPGPMHHARIMQPERYPADRAPAPSYVIPRPGAGQPPLYDGNSWGGLQCGGMADRGLGAAFDGEKGSRQLSRIGDAAAKEPEW
jgi:hypothetical protein